jgi:hypothetical protein
MKLHVSVYGAALLHGMRINHRNKVEYRLHLSLKQGYEEGICFGSVWLLCMFRIGPIRSISHAVRTLMIAHCCGRMGQSM